MRLRGGMFDFRKNSDRNAGALGRGSRNSANQARLAQEHQQAAVRGGVIP